MTTKPEFDQSAAHKFFATDCFNKAWDLIDKPERTAEEDEEMVRLSLTSHWHWTQRDDCSQTNISVGYWQTSRIYALLGQADNALRYGQLCLIVSQQANVPPFFLGYAYEALARAESLSGDSPALKSYLQEANNIADQIEDNDAKQMLLNDLATIQ